MNDARISRCGISFGWHLPVIPRALRIEFEGATYPVLNGQDRNGKRASSLQRSSPWILHTDSGRNADSFPKESRHDLRSVLNRRGPSTGSWPVSRSEWDKGLSRTRSGPLAEAGTPGRRCGGSGGQEVLHRVV